MSTSTKDVLTGALALLRDGKNWGRYDFKSPDGTLCAQGAIIEYVHGDEWSGTNHDAYEYREAGGPVTEAINVLGRHLPSTYDSWGYKYPDVGGFNNTRADFSEIRDWFERAIADEEEMVSA
jgi:hypothetical protein